MSTEFDVADDNSTGATLSAQDDDKRMLFKWGAIIAAIVVITCFITTSLLKVIGVISASWLWVLASAGVSSVITLMVLLLIAVFFAAAFINAIR
jgi:hypothetical protein